MPINSTRPGIYNVEYFSGAQGAIYIGDTWIDEITTFAYSVHQTRRPIFGYASQLFDDVAEGVVMIQGQFTINFKEAGYLWLALNRYKELSGQTDAMYRAMYRAEDVSSYGTYGSPFSGKPGDKDIINRQNIEQIINGETNTFQRNRALQALANLEGQELSTASARIKADSRRRVSASLGGYASVGRHASQKNDKNYGSAESVFEAFENQVWSISGKELDEMHRRSDDPFLNPFDLYLTFGDFAGTDFDNHTIQRLRDVHIIGSSKQVVIDGQPVQEAYSFIARNLV